MAEYNENENMMDQNEMVDAAEGASEVEAVEELDALVAEDVVEEDAEAEVEVEDVDAEDEDTEEAPAAEDLDDLLFDKVNRAARLLRNRKSALADEAAEEAERTKDLVRALRLLELKSRMEEKEMADLLGMRLRALNELLVEAEKNDIVGRIEPEDGDMRKIVVFASEDAVELAEARGNRRKKLVRLTAAGRSFSAERIVPAIEAEDRAFASLSPEERAEFLRLAAAYTDAIDRELARLVPGPDGSTDKGRGETR